MNDESDIEILEKFLYENKDRIQDPGKVVHHILTQITNGIIRDVMLFKPETMFEVSRKYQQKEE